MRSIDDAPFAATAGTTGTPAPHPAARNENARVLAFRPAFRVESVPGEGTYLLSEHGRTVLKGALNAALGRAIDGRHTVDEIVDLLSGEFDPARIYFALHRLEQKGYVRERVAPTPPARGAFWQGVGLDEDDAEARLATRSVGVTSIVGEEMADALRARLAASGIRVAENADLEIVLTDDYLRADLARINAERLRSRRPWLLAKPVGTTVFVGPAFVPGETGCFACMAERLRRNREVDDYLVRRLGRDEPPVTSLAATPASVGLALHMTVVEAAKWIAGATAPDAAVVSLDLATMTSERHALTRRPQCRACGEPGALAATPIDLASQPIRAEEGGYRTASAEETYRRFRHHVSPITGAVTHLEPWRGEGAGALHTYVAGHNFAMDTLDLKSLKKGLRSKSSGKGTSDAQARTGALCEALERYSGIFTGDEPRETTSLAALGDRGIHPNACMLYSERQYVERDAWNGRDTFFHLIPERFDPDARLEWSPLWSLSERRFKFLPTGYLYFSYPRGDGPFRFAADSNGNAAGATREEAIVQGFLELVERDAVALWWYNRLPRPAVDADAFDLPFVREMRRFYASVSREFWVLDLTSDLGIPVYAAISRRVDKPVEDIVFAFGAHFDPKIALLRAITEMNQFLPAVLSIGADGSGDYTFPDAEAQAWWRTATLANQPYLVPKGLATPPGAPEFGDMRDAVLHAQRLVEGKGLEMLVLDQTRPDIGLPVVKVVVPGLRHFWARFAAGRLYDVPVSLGWSAAPTREEDLNPIPIFV